MSYQSGGVIPDDEADSAHFIHFHCSYCGAEYESEDKAEQPCQFCHEFSFITEVYR